MQHMIAEVKKIIKRSSKFDDNYLGVKDVQGDNDGDILSQK